MCLFCEIVNQEVIANVIYEDDDVIAILDLYPIDSGHTLVIPKEHVEDYLSTTKSYDHNIKKVISILKKTMNITGITVSTNMGVNQDVKHLHFHIIPNERLQSNFKILKQTNQDDLKIMKKKIGYHK